jgi:hypothetical protein
MRKYLLATVAALAIVGSGSARAADICKAVALHDVPAVGNPSWILKRGAFDTAITGYHVNRQTGERTFCSHGGSCYPTESLRLTNCKVGAHYETYDNEDIYDVDVIRSAVSPRQLKMDDVDNRMLELGLCSACAGNAAYFYVNRPASNCARIIREALENNPNAIRALKENDGLASGNCAGEKLF